MTDITRREFWKDYSCISDGVADMDKEEEKLGPAWFDAVCVVIAALLAIGFVWSLIAISDSPRYTESCPKDWPRGQCPR